MTTAPALDASSHGSHDAVLLASFGGPEGPDDVIPFLRGVTEGRSVPAHRLEAVAAHYRHFDGVSPINGQCRRIRAALEAGLAAAGHPVRVYWGNLHWTPFLADTVAEMADDGVDSALVLVTSAYSSYSACRRYLDEIEVARAAVGSRAPRFEKVRPYHDHPGFIEPLTEAVDAARLRLPDRLRPGARLVCTAHSIPVAEAYACDYVAQLGETAALLAAAAGHRTHDLVWQSRSGRPHTPWLEPDVNDHLRALAGSVQAVVMAPIGFVSDHMEVVWDLDVQAAATATELGIAMARAATPGTAPDPRFVAMLAELVLERLEPDRRPRRLGRVEARTPRCGAACCPAPGRGRRAGAGA